MRGIIAKAVLLLLAAAPSASALTAGAAKVDITPDLKALAPVVQGGYGARMGRPAEGVHDRIFVRALAVADGERKACLVSMDLTGVPDNLHRELVERLRPELGLDYGSLLLAATHSHSAPGNHSPAPPLLAAIFGRYNQKLYEFIRDRTEQAIRDAFSGLQPARIGVAERDLPGFKRNRRAEEGATINDDAMTVLYAATPQGQPIALVVFFAAHPTVLGADNLLISGEWPGAMARAIEFAMPGVVAMHINGAEGDQSPSGDFGKGYAFVQFYGAALAQQAVELATSAPMQSEGPVASAWQELQLPEAEVSPAFMQTTGKEYNISKEVAQTLIRQLGVSSIPVSALRIGGLVVAAVPGEAISELGLKLKERARAAGAQHAAIAGLAGRDVSYILSEEQYNRGGYEASMSFYGPKLGEVIFSALGRLIEKLAAGQPPG
jgi:neutral ceramidase